MSLQTLHTGFRGTWIYQSPRITLLLTYAEAKGLDPHSPPKTPPKRREAKTPPNLDTREAPAARLPHRERRPPNLDALRRYQKALGLNPQVAQAIDSVLEAFRPKPEDAAALPPLLDKGDGQLEVPAEGDAETPHEAHPHRRPRRIQKRTPLQKSWLYALHLATPHRPTCLGYALHAALEAGVEPEEAYIDKAEELGLLKWIIALEAAALDIGTKNELDALLAAYSRYLPHQDLQTAYSAFRYMTSDVKEITMATPALPIEEILQKLGQ